MADLTPLLAGLDVGERVRGRGFERLCKWVLENEPAYAARLERVWLWDEWPAVVRGARRLFVNEQATPDRLARCTLQGPEVDEGDVTAEPGGATEWLRVEPLSCLVARGMR